MGIRTKFNPMGGMTVDLNKPLNYTLQVNYNYIKGVAHLKNNTLNIWGKTRTPRFSKSFTDVLYVFPFEHVTTYNTWYSRAKIKFLTLDGKLYEWAFGYTSKTAYSENLTLITSIPLKKQCIISCAQYIPEMAYTPGDCKSIVITSNGIYVNGALTGDSPTYYSGSPFSIISSNESIAFALYIDNQGNYNVDYNIRRGSSTVNDAYCMTGTGNITEPQTFSAKINFDGESASPAQNSNMGYVFEAAEEGTLQGAGTIRLYPSLANYFSNTNYQSVNTSTSTNITTGSVFTWYNSINQTVSIPFHCYRFPTV